jgi:hypothetical protein
MDGEEYQPMLDSLSRLQAVLMALTAAHAERLEVNAAVEAMSGSVRAVLSSAREAAKPRIGADYALEEGGVVL